MKQKKDKIIDGIAKELGNLLNADTVKITVNGKSKTIVLRDYEN